MGAKKAQKVETPPDPDPTPMAAGDSTQAVAGAARAERKRNASNYGRSQTILAGNTSQDNQAKKTILGG